MRSSTLRHPDVNKVLTDAFRSDDLEVCEASAVVTISRYCTFGMSSGNGVPWIYISL